MGDLLNNRELLVATSLAALGFLYLLRPKSMPLNVGGPPHHTLPVNPAAIEFIKNFDRVHELFEKLPKDYGDVFHVNLLGTSTIIVSDVDLAKKVMANREAFELPPSMRRSLPYSFGGNGSMFASEGDTWKLKHRILEPMHKINFLRFHALTVSESMTKAVDLLQLAAQDQQQQQGLAIDIVPLLCRATIKVIGHAVFGVDFGVVTNNPSDLEKMPHLAHLFHVILANISNRLNLPELLWPLQYYLTGERAASLEMKGFFRGLLKDKVREREALKGQAPTADRPATTVTTTILDLILQFKEENPDIAEALYSDDEIFDECLSFFGAGFETTTNTASFLLYHLAEYPEVQERAYEEIKAAAEDLKSQGKDLDGAKLHDAFQKLDYLTWVIKESQRINPVVPSLVRTAMRDTEVSGVNFPKGTQVVLNFLPAYHTDRYFSEPEKFIPERWSNEGEKTEKPAYSFGHGARACFGQKLAGLMLKAFIFHLLQRFRVVADPRYPLVKEFCFNLRPKGNEAHLIFVPRK